MASTSLEQRLAALEAKVAQLEANTSAEPPKRWRAAMGMFTGDAGMQAVFETALQLREADRRKTRPKTGTRRRKART